MHSTPAQGYRGGEVKPYLILCLLPLLLGAAPYWYQQSIPYLYSNRDATELRLYMGTPQDYAEITVVYRGKATKEKALKILQPYIKQPK